MNLRLLFLISITSSMLCANNFHNQLIIPSIDVKNPHWEFSHQPINEKEDGAFAELVKKWNNELDAVWTKLSAKIREEINASTQQLDYYLDDQRFIDAYLNAYKQRYAEYMDEEQEPQDIEANVLNYVQLKLYYLQLHKPVKICIKDNTTLLTTSFGTDKAGHYLVINKNVYTAEKIASLYDCQINGTTKYYIEPHTNVHKSRAIETNNLLHLGICQAISSIIHQGDFFAKVLQIFTYNKKQLTVETQSYGIDYTRFQSYLEACLQSKNPLEAALFLEPQMDNSHQEFVLLWRNFIEDIKNCYDEDDLESYEALSLHERRAILYTHYDENEN